MIEKFPWAALLPPDSRQEFEAEYARESRRAKELGTSAELDQMLIEWKATAEIYQDPELVQRLSGPVNGDYGPVPPPAPPWKQES